MVRQPIATWCWLSILASIALVLCALSSPIEILPAPAQVNPDSPAWTLTLTSNGQEVAFASATPGRAFIGAPRFALIEESENETSDLFSHSDSPALIAEPERPPKVFSSFLLGNSPSRTVALPLRC